jgi:hypothetical protein
MFLIMNTISGYIIFALPILLIYVPFGYKLNKISGNKLNKFLSKVKNASSWTNDEPDGWICGKWYIGYITTNSGQNGFTDKTLSLYSTKTLYDNICNNDTTDAKTDTKASTTQEDTNTNNATTINFWERFGTFWYISYRMRKYTPKLQDIWPAQETIINELMEVYEKKQYAIGLICGPPSKGKSYIPLYLCEKLKKTCDEVHLVDTWNPTEPGDSFAAIYDKINPTKKSPLVIVLDEVDCIISSLHNKTVALSDNLPIPIQMKDKKDWNQFLDRFDRNLYQHVFIVLTSNNNLNYFDVLDPSYMRLKRINYRIDMI